VGLVSSLDLRNTLADHRASDNELRLALSSLGRLIGGQNGTQIVTINLLHIPTIGTITGRHILALAHREHGVEGDIIGIVEKNQVVETEMTGERGGLGSDTFLQATITGEHDDMVIKNGMLRRIETGGSHFARHGKANSVGDTLAKWAGGCLDPGSLAELRMTGRDAVKDTEFFNLIKRKIKSGKMQPGIEEHAAVTCGEDEAVAVDPARSGGINLKGMTKKYSSDIGGSERKSEVA